jgi:hypothetical protein
MPHVVTNSLPNQLLLGHLLGSLTAKCNVLSLYEPLQPSVGAYKIHPYFLGHFNSPCFHHWPSTANLFF